MNLRHLVSIKTRKFSLCRLSHIPLHASFQLIWWQLVSQVFSLNCQFESTFLSELYLSASWCVRNKRGTLFENSTANNKSSIIFCRFFFPFFRPQMLMLQFSCPMQYPTRTTQNVLKISIQGPYFKRRQSNPKMTSRVSLEPKQTSAAFVTRCTPALPLYARTCALTQEKSHTSVTSVWSHFLRMPI